MAFVHEQSESKKPFIEEVRAISDSYQSQHIDGSKKRIKHAASNGQKSVSITEYDSHLIKWLTNEGFTVKEIQGDFRDPRESSYITVSW